MELLRRMVDGPGVRGAILGCASCGGVVEFR
jgi:hypothetical protein